MRENEPVLLVLSVYDGKLFLRKGKFYLRNVMDFWEVDSHGNGVGGNYQIQLGLIIIKGTS